jgi:hypothetical protein
MLVQRARQAKGHPDSHSPACVERSEREDEGERVLCLYHILVVCCTSIYSCNERGRPRATQTVTHPLVLIRTRTSLATMGGKSACNLDCET